MLMYATAHAAANTSLININIQLTSVIPSIEEVNIPGSDQDSPVCVIQNVNLSSKATCLTGQRVPLGVYSDKQFLGSLVKKSINFYSTQNQSPLIAPFIQNLRFEKQEAGGLEFIVNF